MLTMGSCSARMERLIDRSGTTISSGDSYSNMSTAVAAPPLALEMRNITKSYPGVRALEDVSFDLRPGEVHALVGENGAGKSTLMKILAGAQPKDSGEILINGRIVHIDSPQKAMDLGVSI